MESEVVASAAENAPASKDRMTSISEQICFLSTGDRAALRRIYLKRSSAATGVIVKLVLGAKVPMPLYEADEDRWQLIAHVAATLSGTAAANAHAQGQAVGKALQAGGYSENRLLRLTSARGPALYDQIGLAGRLLARAGQTPVNLWTLFDLAGNNAIKVEAARVHIAQEFYAAQSRSEGNSK
jgi:hypothetical protein